MKTLFAAIVFVLVGFFLLISADKAQAQTTGGFNPNADNYVLVLAIQSDGKILVGGVFNNISGQVRPGLVRLNSNGSLDTLFKPNLSQNNGVSVLTLQPDGKILVAGFFNNMAVNLATK